MKKTTKIFSAVALSAALAMGCAVPAFATNPDAPSVGDPEGSQRSEKTDGVWGTHTDVYLKAQVNNISVAVPLKVTIGANAEGGAINAPSEGVKTFTKNATDVATTGYRIENNSPFMVYVDTVTAKAVDSAAWVLDEERTGTNAHQAVVAGTTGGLSLTLNPSTATNKDKTDAEVQTTLNGGGNNSDTKNEGNWFTNPTNQKVVLKENIANTPDWALKAKPAGGHPTIMGLTLAGYNSPLANVSDTMTAAGDKVFTVTYTVSATNPRA